MCCAISPRPAQLQRHVARWRTGEPFLSQRRAKCVTAFEPIPLARRHTDAGMQVKPSPLGWHAMTACGAVDSRRAPTRRGRHGSRPVSTSPSTDAAAQSARSGADSVTGSAVPTSLKPWRARSRSTHETIVARISATSVGDSAGAA